MPKGKKKIVEEAPEVITAEAPEAVPTEEAPPDGAPVEESPAEAPIAEAEAPAPEPEVVLPELEVTERALPFGGVTCEVKIDGCTYDLKNLPKQYRDQLPKEYR